MLLLARPGTGAHGAAAAQAIDFDGTNDYLSRGDLVGNTDGKTFTFSFWIWESASGSFYVYTADQTFFRVQINTNAVQVVAQNAAGTYILNGTVNTTIALRTWTHVVISVDLTNTANRSIYINDVAASVAWSTYTNDTIDFTRTTHQVAASGSVAGFPGRFAHIYLDKTYRDLSVTANRRLFVTADLKPAAGQAALNPIVYLTMADPTQPGKNSGTGGDFALTGVVARSGRGPSQYNVPYSTLNGSTQYMNRTAITGLSDGKTFTLSFSVFLPSTITNGSSVFHMGSINAESFKCEYITGNKLRLFAIAPSTFATILDVSFPVSLQRNLVVTISFDMASQAASKVFVNGVSTAFTVTTFTNSNIAFTYNSPSNGGFVGCYNGAFSAMTLGSLWFNTSYLDLSVAANLAKFVTGTGIDAKPVDPGANGELPTGTSPQVYLPMYGNNAGKNYGTGGDFAVQAGPFTAARGPNEFWGNWAGQNLSGYSYRTSALAGASTSTAFTFSAWANFTDPYNNANTLLNFYDGSFEVLRVRITSGQIQIYNQSGGTTQLSFASTIGGIGAGLRHLMVSIDMTNTAKRSVYVDGVLLATTYSTYNTASSFAFGSCPYVGLGCYRYTATNTENMDGKYGEVYFANSYVDLTQEANRLKFRDAFGNPTDLPAAIAAGTIPNPLIYQRFAPGAFGTNAGTGGNFTSVNITDGGQF